MEKHNNFLISILIIVLLIGNKTMSANICKKSIYCGELSSRKYFVEFDNDTVAVYVFSILKENPSLILSEKMKPIEDYSALHDGKVAEGNKFKITKKNGKFYLQAEKRKLFGLNLGLLECERNKLDFFRNMSFVLEIRKKLMKNYGSKEAAIVDKYYHQNKVYDDCKVKEHQEFMSMYSSLQDSLLVKIQEN